MSSRPSCSSIYAAIHTAYIHTIPRLKPLAQGTYAKNMSEKTYAWGMLCVFVRVKRNVSEYRAKRNERRREYHRQRQRLKDPEYVLK